MTLLKFFFYINRINLLATALVFASTVVSAQKAEVDTLLKKFDRYRTTFAPEKLYVHLDQEFYLTGESLWFKLYTVDASLHKPLDISNVAYLEILDKENRPVLQTKIAMQNGIGNGSLFLPASIASGNYTVRAYTNWMKNFDADFYFHKQISIINTFRKLDLEKSNVLSKPDAQFFPEGGNLVAGLKSKIAFRVINSAGKGIEFNGTVVDQNNDTITSFKPFKFGLGSFYFTPMAGHEYRVVIKPAEGQASTYKFPPIHESGYVMHLKDSADDHLYVSVSSSLKEVPKVPAVYLFVHARNMISKAAVHFLQQGSVTITIPKKDLQDGISHITLFDADLRPVCERLYFTPIKNKLVVDVQASQREFGIRRKVSLDISTQNPEHQPQASNLSVSVYKLDSLQNRADDGILSYFLLNSDLKGTIESPGYICKR